MDDQCLPENPFTPTFGEIPLFLAGRERILESLGRAFLRKGRAPELSMLISGARGSGKTALLGKISAEAQAHGWISVDVTAGQGMLEDIIALAERNSADLVPMAAKEKRITGIGIPQVVSLEFGNSPAKTENWRVAMENLVGALESAGSGLLITVDEVTADNEEMVRLAATYQHFVRENRRVALVMAGLPYHVDALKDGKTISFVRRAQHERLARIPENEVARAMRRTVEEGGRLIDDDVLAYAVEATLGFPFMIQLVGYRMWEESPASRSISAVDAQRGVQIAQAEMRDQVLDSTYRELSDGDVAFLRAMLAGGETSTIKEIADRMGKSNAYASTYKTRLLKQGVIGQRTRTGYGFEVPGFREYLQEMVD